MGILIQKDKEELQEIREASSKEERKEELADKLELLIAMASYNGFSLQDIIDEASIKKAKKGDFEKKITIRKIN